MSEKVESFNKERCVKWLKEIGQSSGGTLEELRNKIKMYLRYPKLTNKLKAKANMYYRFKCSLDPLAIPIITAKWSSNEMLYPIVNDDIFYRYCDYKYGLIDNKYGCSPDGLGPSGILLEVKTRAAGFVGPITTLANFPQYYVQCQLQIECTGAEFCVLQSFHPETNTSKCFLVERNNTLLLIIKEIVDAIYERKKIKTWNHLEIKDLLSFGKNIIVMYLILLC